MRRSAVNIAGGQAAAQRPSEGAAGRIQEWPDVIEELAVAFHDRRSGTRLQYALYMTILQVYYMNSVTHERVFALPDRGAP
jgi:hypothetical protein